MPAARACSRGRPLRSRANSLFVANYRFVGVGVGVGTDYLTTTAPSPLQHYWSLSSARRSAAPGRATFISTPQSTDTPASPTPRLSMTRRARPLRGSLTGRKTGSPRTGSPQSNASSPTTARATGRKSSPRPSYLHGISESLPTHRATTEKSSATTASSPKSSSTSAPGTQSRTAPTVSSSGTCTTTTTGPTAHTTASRLRPQLRLSRLTARTWEDAFREGQASVVGRRESHGRVGRNAARSV